MNLRRVTVTGTFCGYIFIDISIDRSKDSFIIYIFISYVYKYIFYFFFLDNYAESRIMGPYLNRN